MFRKCLYCKKRFTLKLTKDFLGREKPLNYVLVSGLGEEKLKYIHKTCFIRYKRDKAKQYKSKLSGGLNVGIATIKGEIEEN